MTVPVETCGICGFDSRMFTHDDVMGTLRAVVPWYELLTEHVDDAILHARPAAGVWSAIEYAEHMADVLNLLAFGVEWMVDEDDPLFPSFPAEPPGPAIATTPLADVMAKLDDGATTMQRAARRITSTTASRTARVGDGSVLTAAWIERHAVHDLLHHLHDIGRNLIALGVGPRRHTGTVEQVNVSDGGVPKRAIPEAEIGPRGLAGDRQATRRHHGRVWQALCLYSAEAVERLQAEGHPIAFGAAGENLTLRGIEWATLRPGVQLRIGDAVGELSVPALPCAQNARWFAGGDFMRMHHEQHRAETRWYARVVAGGIVRAGDPVALLP